MNDRQANEARVQQLVAWYGDGEDGSAPTGIQWDRVLARPAEAPITLVNFFKMRDRARYPEGRGDAAPASGEEAFARYAAVSVPTVEKVGGRFLLLGPFEGSFMGAEEDWDLVAVGSYPNAAAALALYEDPDYRTAFIHRTAACERQKVLICAA